METRQLTSTLAFGIEVGGPTGRANDHRNGGGPAVLDASPSDGVLWIPDTLSPEDEFRHEPLDDPMWREGAYISFHDEASGMYGNSWMGIRPQVGRAEVHFVVWQGDDVVHRYTNWGGFQIPREQPRNPFEYGPVQYRCIDPHRHWQYRFDDGVCRVDLDWHAVNPVYDYPWEALTGSRHVEHGGRVEGSVTVGGTTTPISGFGQRDRAWGMRNHSDYGHWIWLCPQFSDDFVINVGTVSYRGEDYVYGFIWKDGRQGELTRLELSTEYTFLGGPPARARALLEDDLGRCTTLEVEPRGMYPNAFGDIGKMGLIYIGQARYIADGRVGYGVCDYCWTDVESYATHYEVARR